MLGYAVEHSHCSGSIIQLLPLYKGLNFLTAENLENGKIHPLFKINCLSVLYIMAVAVLLSHYNDCIPFS
jgi:hypothetical protein